MGEYLSASLVVLMSIIFLAGAAPFLLYLGLSIFYGLTGYDEEEEKTAHLKFKNKDRKMPIPLGRSQHLESKI